MSLAPSYRRILLCVLLALVTVGAYSGVRRNGFVDLDDDTYITRNPHIASGVSWKTVKWAATTFYASNWHPLTWISHAADVGAFGLNPTGHHAVNLALHVTNGILLFVLLWLATGREWESWLVAALFALHPVNVESVAWASERKNVLSMMFLLLTMIFYTTYARKRSVWRYAAMILCFALGLLAKPQIVTLPFLLLLWDFWPLGRWPTQGVTATNVEAGAARLGWAAWFAEKVPLFCLSGFSAWLTMKAQSAGGAVQISDATRHAVAAFPIGARVKNAVVAYGQYLLDAVWPTHLAAMYPHPGESIRTGTVLVSAAVLLAITVVVFAAWHGRGYLGASWLWFLGAMVPMIGIVQVGSQARADRYTYLPFIGLFLMMGYVLAEIGARWTVVRPVCTAAACVALVSLGVVTYRQVGYWRNPEALWTHTLAITKGNFFAHDSLAAYLLRAGRMPEACAHYQASLQIFPDDVPAQEGLAVCYQARGDLKDAIVEYENVLRLSADSAVRSIAFANLGSIYRHLGDYSQAKQNYESALQLNPDMPIALVGSGLLAQKGWDFAKAAQQYAHAMKVEPTSVGYLLLAKALEQGGHSAEAKAAYASAQKLTDNLFADQKEADSLLAE